MLLLLLLLLLQLRLLLLLLLLLLHLTTTTTTTTTSTITATTTTTTTAAAATTTTNTTTATSRDPKYITNTTLGGTMALPEVDGGGGSSSSTASASSSSSFPRCEAPARRAQAPHEVGGLPVDYRLVIPTRGRWRPASEISTERALKRDSRPFILVKTLAFLKRQQIPPRRVSLYLSRRRI